MEIGFVLLVSSKLKSARLAQHTYNLRILRMTNNTTRRTRWLRNKS